jgi:hypothetical protein
MQNGMDQVRAWKDSEAPRAADADHPSGKVRVPLSRGHVARAMVLAGVVLGLGMVSEMGTAVGTTTGP